MTTNETTRVLHELKLPGMTSCWNALEETHQLDRLMLREGMQGRTKSFVLYHEHVHRESETRTSGRKRN